MKLILFFIVLLFILSAPNLIFFVLFNFPLIFTLGFSDIYYYFKHKKYNECHEFGKIRLNSAKGSQVFGCGKTLTLVRQAVEIYKKYNDKLVWSENEKKFVKQHIHIISNVTLYDVPYIKWEGVNQFTELEKYGFPEQDVTLFLLDESGVIFNSRNFRDNISVSMLTTLLQSRKNKICLYMTSQRFQFTDKLLRQSCSTITTCRKWWRIVEVCEYDAFSVENALNPSLVKPLSTRYWIAKDKDYHSYDSYQLIETFVKNNDFIPDQE